MSSILASLYITDANGYRAHIGPVSPDSDADPYAVVDLFPACHITVDDPEVLDALLLVITQARDDLAEAILRRQR